MPRDKSANHIKLMAAARAEFLELGFEKASMRSIGERCGMTAAGLYRHCRDKEDLFDQLVSPAVVRLNTWLKEHVERYVKAVESSRDPQWRDSWIDMMREVVYPHMEDYILLVARSRGTKYENFLHDLTETGQEQFLSYLPVLRELGYPVWDISPQHCICCSPPTLRRFLNRLFTVIRRRTRSAVWTPLKPFFSPAGKS